VTVQAEAKKYALFIDGEWRPASSGSATQRLNPADQSPVATLPLATESDLDAAVGRIGAEIETLAPLLSREVGKPLGEARIEVLSMMNTFEAYAVWSWETG